MQSWLKWDSLGSPNSPRNVISINLSPHPGGKNRTPKRETSMRPKSPISIHRHQVYCSVPGVDSQTPTSFAACGEVTSFGKKRTNILKGMQASKCSHQYIILCVFFKFLGRKKKKNYQQFEVDSDKNDRTTRSPFWQKGCFLGWKKNGFLEAKRKEMFVQRCNPQKDGGLEVCIFPTSTHWFIYRFLLFVTFGGGEYFSCTLPDFWHAWVVE